MFMSWVRLVLLSCVSLSASSAESYFFATLDDFLLKRHSHMKRRLLDYHSEYISTPDSCARLRIFAGVHKQVHKYPSAEQEILKDLVNASVAVIAAQRHAPLAGCAQSVPAKNLRQFFTKTGYSRFAGRIDNSLFLSFGFEYDVFFLRLLGMLEAMDVASRDDWQSVFRLIVSPSRRQSRRRLHLGIFGPYVAELDVDWKPKTTAQMTWAMIAVHFAKMMHCPSDANMKETACQKLALLSVNQPKEKELHVTLTERNKYSVSSAFVPLLVLD